MNIRTRITLIFFVLVIFIVSAITSSIYFFSSQYRAQDFARRLRNRAVNTAKVLFEYQQFDATLLIKMERENPASLPGQFIKIYTRDGKELYNSDEADIIEVQEENIKSVLRDGELSYTSDKYEIIAFKFERGAEVYVIFAGATDLYGVDALQNLRNIIFITFCISVLIVSIVGYVYAGRILRPISRIVTDVESITEESLDKRLEEGNTRDELARLAQTFNRMLARLQSAFSSQKTFIANASHELKTPFTVMAGEIEVTLMQPREKEYYVKILSSVLDTIKRFNRLSTQLLLLAQTSSDNPTRKFHVLRIDDILWDAKHELEKYHPHYRIELEFDININYENLQVQGDEQLLKVLVMNLMDNGCKYADDSTVWVSISTGVDNFLNIQFRNTGEGIEQADMPRIFDPFYRGATSKKRKGFGIGLSLAEKVIKLHNGTINVTSVVGAETRFTLSLPTNSASSIKSIKPRFNNDSFHN
jgi:signal transduction histidine kinase